MYRFEYNWILWGLLLLPFMIFIFLLLERWRKRARARFAEESLFGQLMPEYSAFRYRLKFVFFLLGFGFLLLGLANPQIGSKLEEVKREGIDLMIALDVSNSMKAEDLKPNRLEFSKRAITQLLEQLKGDRIGMIVFAAKAYTQLPITTDYSAAKLFLNTVNTDIVPVQGTNIADAINLAVGSYDFKQGGNKVLIIISDGENHEEDAVEAAVSAREKGVMVFTIGMGTPNGAPIPMLKNGRKAGYRQTEDGSTVISSLNEEMLREIASAGGGIYVRASNSNAGLMQILDELSGMEKGEFESKMYTDYEDRFQIFIGAAIFFLLLSWVITEKKSKLMKKINLFDAKSK